MAVKRTCLKTITEIISLCKNKDQRAQKVLYERYFPYCLKIVFRYISQYDGAVDVVNDGFVKVFTKFDKFQCDQVHKTDIYLMGWMKTIMINTAIDKLRKNNFLPEIGYSNENLLFEDRSQLSDNNVLYKELILEIKKLPAGYRAVFNLYVIDGYNHQEIANLLQIAVGTSKSNLSKAKGLLQKFLQKSNYQKAVCCL